MKLLLVLLPVLAARAGARFAVMAVCDHGGDEAAKACDAAVSRLIVRRG